MSETKCPNCNGTGIFEHCTECGGPGCVYCNIESGDNIIPGKDCAMCRGTGNREKSQKQEMQDAQKEGRIPKCVSCNHEIRQIMVVQHEYIDWTYDESSKQYVKGEYDHGDSDKPRHDCKVQGCACEAEDWDLLDENSKASLGVIF